MVVPDKTLSLNQGAIYAWATRSTTTYYHDLLLSVCSAYSINMDKPFEKLSKKEQDIILYGSDEAIKIRVKQFGTSRYQTNIQPFVGVIPFLEKRYNDASGDYWREEIENLWLQNLVLIAVEQGLNHFRLQLKSKTKTSTNLLKCLLMMNSNLLQIYI